MELEKMLEGLEKEWKNKKKFLVGRSYRGKKKSIKCGGNKGE